MSSVLEWLFGSAAKPRASGDTETVKRIAAELDKLPPERARYLAAFAYVLSRVAGADQRISEEELRTMVALLMNLGGLSEPQAMLVAEIAKTQNLLSGGTENFLVTREFRLIASEAERHAVLDCLFQVAVADDEISAEEDAQLWQIAGELGFDHQAFVTARLAYSDKRAVLRKTASPGRTA